MNLIKTEISGAAFIIQISRPEALNALNQNVMDELRQCLQSASQNNDIAGIVITGDGEKAFVAGADIKELAMVSGDEATKMARKGQNLFNSIEHCLKPVIAVVNGFALGGGCELAMACHIRIATENARFGQPEVNLGIIPGYGGTQRLPQLVGRAKALELILTADIIPAAEALRIGLVNHVVLTKQEALDMALGMIKKIAAKGPVAIAKSIESVNAGYGFEEKGYEAEARNFGACAETGDFKEGTKAFVEKRAAKFGGK
ncbi:MAG TPA: enoyl-CoA hydratase-related protein [Cyclobacteriaceae bacterium]|nr:enoyl-CoA hydratase-related protein [Cyclobacteriaceae bacterium]